jgi:hypothetical protein
LAPYRDIYISKTEILWHTWHHLTVSDQYVWHGSHTSHTAQKASDFLNLPVSQPTAILYYWLGLALPKLLVHFLALGYLIIFLKESKTCQDLG